MEQAFSILLNDSFSQLKNTPVLLAVSGGLDSTVLAYLCQKNKLDFAIAHCNFKLRGSESDADAAFVSELGQQFDKKVFVQAFDTEAFAASNKVSIQMAARELRYAWFEELCEEHGFKHVLTAHHAQDDLETFLINLGRGTGLDGLTGIAEENERIVRPLLSFSRKEIQEYAAENAIEWREDSSNASDKYLRNHLRHHAIPALEEANPQFLEQFKKSQLYLQDSKDLLEDYTALLYSKIVSQSFKGYDLNIQALKEAPHTRAVLYQLLKDFGFTAWDDIYNLLDAQSGKYVSTGVYRLIKDRDVLILSENKNEILQSHSIAEGQSHLKIPGLSLHIEKPQEYEDVAANEAIFDADLVHFPLELRKWKEGDTFYPFGMNGKKKISKLFKDLKYSTIQKEEAWVLCSNEKIIWVVGVRSDERFKITPSTSRLLKCTVLYD